MNILFYLYPGILPLGPDFNESWTILLCQLCRKLAKTGQGNYCVITAQRFASHLLTLPDGVKAGTIDEIDLHRSLHAAGLLAGTPSVLSWLANIAEEPHHQALAILADRVKSAAGEFKPDIIITFSLRANYLKLIWPDVFLLYTETGAFSRKPYPFSLFFDHEGMYCSSTPARGQMVQFESSLTDEMSLFVSDFKRWSRNRLQSENPFTQFDVFDKFDATVLFPLQVSNYHSFNEHTHHETQFEYLVDFLLQTPPDVGVVVTEYVQWGSVLNVIGPTKNLSFLKQSFPNLIFSSVFRKYTSPSPYLALMVDGVWTIVSNLGYQALLSGKRLGTTTASYLKNVAHDHSINDFFANLSQKPEQHNGFLAWYLSKYLVPESILDDGQQLYDYLVRRMAAAGSKDQLVPVASTELLRKVWMPQASAAKAEQFALPISYQIHRRIMADAVLAREEHLGGTSCVTPDDEISHGTYILLNATDKIENGVHLGCNIVNLFIKNQMAALRLTAFGVANTAKECTALLTLPGIEKVRLVILNGEGSMHHDSGRCRELLEFCSLLKRFGSRCVLINTVWQCNTEFLGGFLHNFDLVSVRESRSLQEIQAWYGSARLVPDISFAAFKANTLGTAKHSVLLPNKVELTVVDSVNLSIAKQLHSFAEFHQFPFYLMGPLHKDILIDDISSGYEVQLEVFPRYLRSCHELQNAKACLTGRFHGLVASFSAGLPVVCLPSNTHKIEGMLEDFGMSSGVLLPEEWLLWGNSKKRDCVYSLLSQWGAEHSAKVEVSVAQAVSAIYTLFEDIKVLL